MVRNATPSGDRETNLSEKAKKLLAAHDNEVLGRFSQNLEDLQGAQA